MIKHLLIKKMRVGIHGGLIRRLVVREQKGEFVIGEAKDTALQKNKDILITGFTGAKKSKWLSRINKAAPELWPKKRVVYVRQAEPIATWLKGYEGKPHEKREQWLNDFGKNTVLIIDDIDKMAGSKLDMIKQAADIADVLIVTSAHEMRVPASIRIRLLRGDCQHIKLSSMATQDGTIYLVMLATLMAAITGNWALAAFIGGTGAMWQGKRGSKD